MSSGPKIVVMGVAGCGKTHVGARVAAAIGVPFFDGDEFHGEANVRKMAAGIPLDDDDRAGWLDRVAALIAAQDALVVTCSALKRRYRDRLRQAAPDLAFLYLEGAYDLVHDRLTARTDHFFTGDDMLRSQFAALEPPGPDEAAHALDIDRPVEAVVAACVAALQGAAAGRR